MAEHLTLRNSKLVGVNERGGRVGEDHGRATLTNHEVDLIRELSEGGMSQRTIAEKFEISRGTVGDIVRFRRRATYPVGWRRVRVTLKGAEIAGKSPTSRPPSPIAND